MFEEVLKLIKDVVDPEFEDITVLDKVKVVLEEEKENTPGWLLKFQTNKMDIKYFYREQSGRLVAKDE